MPATEPKDLIRAIYDAGIGPVDRGSVEAILANSSECLPLVLDMLNSQPDDAVVARALALTGEIGGASELARVFPFFAGEEEEDDAVTECAEWAGRRISRRLPAESLTAMTELAMDAGMPVLSDICKTLRHLQNAGVHAPRSRPRRMPVESVQTAGKPRR
jgi:hypothetical protein